MTHGLPPRRPHLSSMIFFVAVMAAALLPGQAAAASGPVEAVVATGLPAGPGDRYPAVGAGVADGSPTTGDSVMRVGRSAADVRQRVFLDFDLPGLDIDELWNATFVVRAAGCSGTAVSAYAVDEPWAAETVDWPSQPRLGELLGTVPVAGCDSTLALDVTDAVRSWSNGASRSYGIALIGDESRSGTERLFASIGSVDGPYLLVNGRAVTPESEAPPNAPPVIAAARTILVRGVAVETDGSPVGGAAVDVFVYGDSAGTSGVRLAHSVTEADGSFVVFLDPGSAEVADAVRRNGGWVDLELLVSAGTRSYPRVFSRRVADQSWAVDETGALAVDDPIRIELDSPSAIAAGGPGVRTFAVAGTVSAAGCPGYQVTLLGTELQPTKIGQMQIANDAYMEFSYGERAHSSLEVLVSRNGGPFVVYGLLHRGSGETNSVGTWRDFRRENANFGKWFRTNFEYRKIRTRFDCQNTHWVEDSISAKRWVGGFDLIGDLTHLNGRCSSTYRRFKQWYGSGWVEHEGRKLKKYGWGATVFGVGLGAQSYGERWVKWRYNFGTKYSAHWICGDSDYPIYARTVYAGL